MWMCILWSTLAIKVEVFHYDCETFTSIIWLLIFNYITEWSYCLYAIRLLIFVRTQFGTCIVILGGNEWICLLLQRIFTSVYSVISQIWACSKIENNNTKNRRFNSLFLITSFTWNENCVRILYEKSTWKEMMRVERWIKSMINDLNARVMANRIEKVFYTVNCIEVKCIYFTQHALQQIIT